MTNQLLRHRVSFFLMILFLTTFGFREAHHLLERHEALLHCDTETKGTIHLHDSNYADLKCLVCDFIFSGVEPPRLFEFWVRKITILDLPKYTFNYSFYLKNNTLYSPTGRAPPVIC